MADKVVLKKRKTIKRLEKNKGRGRKLSAPLCYDVKLNYL